jgi:hypothetical protein
VRLGDVVWRSSCRSVLSTMRAGLMAEGVDGQTEAVLSSADIREFRIVRSKGTRPGPCDGDLPGAASVKRPIRGAVLFGGPDASALAGCWASFLANAAASIRGGTIR